MPDPRPTVLDGKARELAHRLAQRENRSVVEILERALEAYEARELHREPAAAFYARLAANCGTDIDLDAVIREGRRPHSGPDFSGPDF